MCAQFTIKASPKKLAQQFELPFVENLTGGWEERILPHNPAPIIRKNGPSRTLQAMNFSLIPAWSKEPKVKFATYNARLRTFDEQKKREVLIFEKPTWRDAFQSRRCLVPISEFIEPAYTGKLAGHMIRFSGGEDTLLVAAGIWEEWTNKQTGEVIDSFAIITDDPDPFVKDLGHDRMPIFLDHKSFEAWLEPGKKDNRALVELLDRGRAEIALSAESDRPLKAGWEKRKGTT